MSTIVVDKNQPSRVVVVLQTGPQGPAGAAVGAVGTGFLHYTANIVDGARAVNPATPGDVTVGGANTVLTSNGTVGAWAQVVDANVAAAAAIAVSKLAAGSNGQFLSVTAGVPTWVASPSLPPGGLNTQVQWNNAGAFGGVVNLTTDGTNVTKLQVSADPTWTKAGQVGTLSWTPTAARTLTLPDATDTVVGRATTDTLTNKTINDDTNTIADSVTNAAGDLLKNNATKYVRFARGAASTVLTVNSGGTDLVYAQIVDANIAGSAAINVTKLANSSASFVMVMNAGATAWAPALLVDANVSGTAAIASSKLGAPGSNTQVMWNNAGTPGADGNFTYAAGVATLGTALALGANTATTGKIRLPTTQSQLVYRNAALTGDIVAMATSAGDNLFLGCDTTVTSTQAKTYVSGLNDLYLCAGGSANVDVSLTQVALVVPMVGGGAGSSTPWSGCNGTARPTMIAGTNVALAADYAMTFIELLGSPAGIFNYDLPSVTTALKGYGKFVWNTTNTAATIRMVGDATHTAPLGSTMGAWFWIDERGVHKMTGDFLVTNV